MELNLVKTREKIDEIDKQLISLLEERLNAVVEVARYKEDHNMAIYDADREADVFAKNMSYLRDPALKQYAEEFLLSVMNIAKKYQKNIMHQQVFLVGMPGSGKTTIGRALAKELGVDFFDVDALIQEKTDKSLQNIIINEGEPAFREYEYDVLKDIISKEPAVIATGGGTVLSDATVKLMRDAGIVVFVHRDVKQILDDLDLEIRPLLKESIEYIFRLYEERYPLYEKVSHIKIQNASSVSEAVEQIKAALPTEYK